MAEGTGMGDSAAPQSVADLSQETITEAEKVKDKANDFFKSKQNHQLARKGVY